MTTSSSEPSDDQAAGVVVAGRDPSARAVLRRRADRWNLTCNVIDGTLSGFAFTIVAQDYMLSPFLRRAGASDTLIGTISALVMLSTALLPLVAVHYVQRLRRKKAFVLTAAAVQRTHLFIVPVLAVLVLPFSPHMFFVLYIASAVVNSASSQVVMPAWLDLVGKTTPVTKRGLLWAGRNITGLLAAAALSTQIKGLLNTSIGLWDLGEYNFVWNYSLVFLISAVTFALAMVCIGALRERGGAIHMPPPGLGEIVHMAPRLLGRDRQFTWFLVSQVLLMSSAGMVGGFFVLTSQNRFLIRTEDVMGGYMTVGLVATIAGNVLFAWLGDRYGHRLSLILASPLLILACTAAAVMPDPRWYTVVFAFTGLSAAARTVSNMPILMEFGGEDKRTQYSAVYVTAVFPLLACGPYFGGYLRDHAGLNVAFGVAMAVSLVGMFVMARFVHDPRSRARGQTA